MVSIFCLKQLDSPLRIGQRLQQTRQEQGLTLDDISNKTRIAIKYLEAIEGGSYENLPCAKAHRRAYLKNYARALGLDPARSFYLFSKESDLQDYGPMHPSRSLKIRSLNSLSHIIKVAGAALFIAAFLGYLAWQIKGIIQPPKLVVFAPNEGYVSNSITTMVQGETEKEVKLSVNGQNIMANDQGRFEINIDLAPGINTLTISATKKHGKTNTITRHVIVRQNAVVKAQNEIQTTFNY